MAHRVASLFFAVSVSLLAGPLRPAFLSAQVPVRSAILGRVTDATTGEPVPGALVRIPVLGREEITGQEGHFHFRQVPPGVYLLTVQHIAYGTKGDSVTVRQGEPVGVSVRVSPAAIELEPLIVEVRTLEEEERRARGTRVNLVTRDELRKFEGRPVNVGEVLTALIPNLTMRSSAARLGSGICIEFRRPASLREPLGCKMPMVVVDNVRVPRPEHFLESLSISDVESIEVLPAAEAGVLYGTDSRYGVLKIRTRRPGPERGEEEEARLAGAAGPYDWSLEPRGHPWQKALLASAIGNLAGLGLAMLGRDCIRLYGPSPVDCGTTGSVLAGLAAMSLSLAGATFGATRFGATELSVGKPFPTALLATAVMIPAYALIDAARRVPNGGGEWLGGALIVAGVPAAATLGDHLFRRVRNPASLIPRP